MNKKNTMTPEEREEMIKNGRNVLIVLQENYDEVLAMEDDSKLKDATKYLEIALLEISNLTFTEDEE